MRFFGLIFNASRHKTVKNSIEVFGLWFKEIKKEVSLPQFVMIFVSNSREIIFFCNKQVLE